MSPPDLPLEQRKTLVLLVKEWAAVTIAVMVLLGGFAGFVLNTAHAQAAELAESTKRDAGRLEGELLDLRARAEIDRKASAAAELEHDRVHGELRGDIHEVQADVRELYRLMNGAGMVRRSERLEQPTPQKDGGQ